LTAFKHAFVFVIAVVFTFVTTECWLFFTFFVAEFWIIFTVVVLWLALLVSH
jgi:hypothetical protein